MNNTFNKFQDLIGSEPVTVVTVISKDTANDTSTVTTSGGITVVVKGTSVNTNSKAYVKGGVIQRAAPDITLVEVDI